MLPIKTSNRLDWRRVAPVVILVAVIGIIAVALTHAATSPAAFEPELGALTGNAVSTVVSGASGGRAVSFNGAIAATPTPTPVAGARTCPAFPAFPTASCTGTIAGSSLTPMASYSSTGVGQTISNLSVSGDIDIEHNNVTVNNTRVKGHIHLNGHTGITIQDSDVGPDACSTGTSSGVRTINGDSGYTLIRTHIHNNNDDLMSIGGGAPVVYQDSIIDQGCFYAGDHLDAVQWYDPSGTGTITLIHNIINVTPANSTDKGNSALFIADGAHSGTKITAYNNKFGGGQITTALYDAIKNSGIVIDLHDNVYIKNSWAGAPCSFGSSVKSIVFDGTSGVKYSNNTLDDGTPVACN